MVALVPLTLIYLVLNMVTAQYETPNTNDGTGEYYVVTSSDTSKQIRCTHASLCSVECTAQDSCRLATIDASSSATLILKCIAQLACYQATVIGPSDTADVQCVSLFGHACGGSGSTARSTFSFTNTKNVNLLCDRETDTASYAGSCDYLSFTATNAETVSVTCAGQEDCKYATFNVDSVSSSASFVASGYDSLASSTINAASANRLSLQCNAGNACKSADIYPPYNDLYVFSLTCANLASSCGTLDIHIPLYRSFTNNWADVGCPITSAITGVCDVNWYCDDLPSSAKPTDMLFSSSNGRWQCETTNALCCPWSNQDEISKLPTKSPTTAEPSNSPTEITNPPTSFPTTPSGSPVPNPTKAPIITESPTKAPTPAPTDNPTEKYVAGDGFPGYTLFVRGFNIWKVETSGQELLDKNYYDANVEVWTDEGSTCSLSSLEFDSSFSSYSEYAESSSTSIQAGYGGGSGSAGGSLSKERTETKSYAASAQTYIYSLDLECSLSEASLNALNKLHWSSNFINNFRALPDSFDSDDMDPFSDFWDSFGTHLIKTGKFGGRVAGAITVDKCSVETSYSSSESYQVCLNAAYSGASAEGCHGETTSSGTGSNTQNSITNQRIVVKGGSTAVFTDVFNSFSDKTNDFQMWIDGLDTEPDVIGGNLDEIHDVIKSAINLGNHNFNLVSDVDLTDEEWIAQANVLEEAYEYYNGILVIQETDLETECQLHCGEGTLDKTKCECNKCGEGTKCCGLNDGANVAQLSLSVVTMVVMMCAL